MEGNPVVADIHDPLGQTGEQRRRHTVKQNPAYRRKIHLSRPQDTVDGLSHQDGQIQRSRHSESRHHNGDQDKKALWF